MKPSRGQLRLNMRSVAQHAGVSSATVSRVINSSGPVKEETAKHVRRVLEELNFIPNPIATTLKYGRSNTYGVIIPDLTNPFYPEFLFNFEDVLVENDYELLIATTQSSEPKLINSVRRMLMRQVDGVVLMASELDTRAIEPLLDRKIPIVTMDRRRAQEGTGDVAIDFEDGYRRAVQHLHQLGHRRIGFIAGTEGIRTSEIRLKAFQKALQAAGLIYDPRLMRPGNYRVAGGDSAMRSLLTEANRPTAVITANDLTAFGALRALHARGISVPSEMSLVGFDGIMLTDAVYPPLTTVAVSPKDIAKACARALDQIKSNISRRGLRLNVRGSLVVRESTAPARARGRTSAKGSSKLHM
jgi:DNA-binding LacI/PurR family transcriptional regulator